MKYRDVLHVACFWFLSFVVTLLILSYDLKFVGDFSTTPRFLTMPTFATSSRFTASRLEDFRRDWLRQRRARVDWQGMMESCKDDMAWDPVKWDKIHRSDASTSEIVSWDIRPAGEFSKIFIQSKTSDNRTKLIGGDTWRVDVQGQARVPATVFDHQNGTYEALFLLMEPGFYQLMIYLDYSLCDGFRDPPPDWFINGNSMGKCQNLSILGRPPNDHLLLQSFKNWLNITVPEAELNSSLSDKLEGLEYRSHACKHLWDGFGRWTKDNWEPLLEESNTDFPMPSKGYNKSGTLWFYGDSLAKNVFDSVVKLPLCTKAYSRCRLSYNWVYPVPWGARPDICKLPNDDFDIQTDKIIGYIVDVLRKPEMQSYDSTLLLNIGLHMGSTVNFTTYQKLIGDLINTLKETTVNSRRENGVSKYKARVIWKTTTAVRQKDRAKAFLVFLTSQRILLFNAYATSAMCKAGFDVIDVYPMTDSNPEALKDHAHYTKLDGFYDSVATSLEKYKLKNMLAP